MNLFLGVIVFLSVIERSSQLPLVCKEGKFYEDSVFDYFNCSLCIEQSHYANCDVCCTTTPTPSTSIPTPVTEAPKLQSSSEASQIVEDVPGKRMYFTLEELVIIGFFVGFLAGALIAGISMLTARYCSKRRKKLKELKSSNTQLGMQETQLNSSSPMVLGQGISEPVAAEYV